MASQKAAAVILTWVGLLLTSIVLAVFSTFFAGVVAGALVTAIAFAVTVKWSIEGLVSGTFDDVERMQETLTDQQPSLSDLDE